MMNRKKLYFSLMVCFLIPVFSENLTHEKFARHVMTYFADESDFPKTSELTDCFNYLEKKGIVPEGGFGKQKIISVEESVQLFGKLLSVNQNTKRQMDKRIDQHFKNRVTILKLQGDVLVKLKNKADWISASKDLQLKEGDLIKTALDSWTHLRIGTLGTVLLKENSFLDLSTMKLKKDGVNEDIHLHLNKGKLLVNVQGMSKQSEFKTSTPSTIVAVRGTIYEVVAD